jgi:hypothetical protein
MDTEVGMAEALLKLDLPFMVFVFSVATLIPRRMPKEVVPSERSALPNLLGSSGRS